jgi:hypothetical protein
MIIDERGENKQGLLFRFLVEFLPSQYREGSCLESGFMTYYQTRYVDNVYYRQFLHRKLGKITVISCRFMDCFTRRLPVCRTCHGKEGFLKVSLVCLEEKGEQEKEGQERVRDFAVPSKGREERKGKVRGRKGREGREEGRHSF